MIIWNLRRDFRISSIRLMARAALPKLQHASCGETVDAILPTSSCTSDREKASNSK